MTTAPRRPRAPTAPKLVPGLRAGLVWTALLAAGGSLLAAGLDDRAGVLGVLVGCVLLAGFFSGGALTVGLVAGSLPAASLMVALLTYMLQVVVLGMVFWVLTGTGAVPSQIDPSWLAGTLIVGALGWTVALLSGARRDRRPMYDLSARERAAGGPGRTERTA